MSDFEHCCECDSHTGRAGRGDDSLYAGSRGPYCEECWGELPDRLSEECDDKDARIANLESRLAAAEADAERHRWLRDRGDDCQWQNLLRVEVDEFESIDEAIDKARGDGDE